MAISNNYRVLYTENDVRYVFSTSAFSDLVKEKYKESRVTSEPLTKEQIWEALADITCKSSESVKKWGKGDNGPSDIEVVKDIAKYFEVDFHALLTTTENSSGRTVPEIYGKDEKSIVMQFYSILTDFIYDYVCTNNTCYAIKHQSQTLTTEDVDGYIYDIYRQLDKIALSVSDKTYDKLHRIITECKTLGDLGYSPEPYLDGWLADNKRWKELNPRLKIIGNYAQMEDYWDAKEYFETEEFDDLMKPFRDEVGQIEVIMNGETIKEDFAFFDSYLLIPMELAKTLKLVFKKDFADLFE